MEIGFNFVVVLILCLLAGILLIIYGKQGIYDLGVGVMGWISPQERCQGRVPVEFEQFIEGYNGIEEYNLCKTYRDCFFSKYKQFVKKNKEVCQILEA